MTCVYVPGTMRRFTSGRGLVLVPDGTLHDVLSGLEQDFPGIDLRDDDGRIHAHILVFVNGDQVDESAAVTRMVGERDEIQIVPAVAGGHAAT